MKEKKNNNQKVLYKKIMLTVVAVGIFLKREVKLL